jgi:hypothetical protein
MHSVLAQLHTRRWRLLTQLYVLQMLTITVVLEPAHELCVLALGSVCTCSKLLVDLLTT